MKRKSEIIIGILLCCLLALFGCSANNNNGNNLVQDNAKNAQKDVSSWNDIINNNTASDKPTRDFEDNITQRRLPGDAPIGRNMNNTREMNGSRPMMDTGKLSQPCEGKDEGDSCTSESPMGEREGTCQLRDTLLICMSKMPVGVPQ